MTSQTYTLQICKKKCDERTDRRIPSCIKNDHTINDDIGDADTKEHDTHPKQ